MTFVQISDGESITDNISFLTERVLPPTPLSPRRDMARVVILRMTQVALGALRMTPMRMTPPQVKMKLCQPMMKRTVMMTQLVTPSVLFLPNRPKIAPHPAILPEDTHQIHKGDEKFSDGDTRFRSRYSLQMEILCSRWRQSFSLCISYCIFHIIY